MPEVFAYGSNILRERLLERCPSISFAGRLVLTGHRLAFHKASEDDSGKGAFVEAEGESVLVVV